MGWRRGRWAGVGARRRDRALDPWGRAICMWASCPSAAPGDQGPRTGRPEGGASGGSAPRTAAARAASVGLWDPRGQKGGGRGPGAGPGVGGRDWRLLLRAARAVSSLEPRCRRAARAGWLRHPQLGALLLFLPRVSSPSWPERSRTGTRLLTSKPCDVKDVPAERHFRWRGWGEADGGGAGQSGRSPAPGWS